MRITCIHAVGMSVMIQIRNVPDALHRRLKARAAMAGMSLSDFLLGEIRQTAERPTLDELRARLAQRRPVMPSVDAGGGGSSRARSPVIVVDASAVIETLLRTPAAEAIEARLFDPRETLHAPHLLDVEVAQAIRRYAAHGDIDGERGAAALADLADLPLRRYPHDFLLPRVWELRRTSPPTTPFTLRSPKRSNASLFTRDRRLAGAAGLRIQIELA